jgi:hypothetical protein
MRNVAFDALQAGGAKKTCRRLLSVDSSTRLDLRARGSESHRRDVTALRSAAKGWRFAVCQSASQKVKALRRKSKRFAPTQSAPQQGKARTRQTDRPSYH